VEKIIIQKIKSGVKKQFPSLDKKYIAFSESYIILWAIGDTIDEVKAAFDQKFKESFTVLFGPYEFAETTEDIFLRVSNE
jgi:hypothetical protein